MEDKRKRTRHSVLDPSRDDEESEHIENMLRASTMVVDEVL